MSIFGDITDDILGIQDENNQLNQNIDDGELPGDSDNENDKAKSDEEEKPIKVEPKRKILRNPRLRLTLDTLKGNRGIHTIEKYFTDIVFHGKGCEKEDLNEIMRRLQHWGHRMYPNYKFDDVLANIDRLGKKKALQVHMTRYRLDQLEPDRQPNDINVNGNIDHDEMLINDQNEPFDEFDALLDVQISKTITVPKTPGSISISSSTFNTPHLNRFTAASTPCPRENSDYLDLATPIPSTPPRSEEQGDVAAAGDGNILGGSVFLAKLNSKNIETKLSSDQLAKIAENRRKAQEKLRAKKEVAILSNSLNFE